MFVIIKKMFILLLTSIVNTYNPTKFVSLSTQKCEIKPNLINLHPNECNQEFHYYPFATKLHKCIRGCNTRNDLSNRVCVPDKIENLNIHVLNTMTGKNKSKIWNLMGKNVIQINC